VFSQQESSSQETSVEGDSQLLSGLEFPLLVLLALTVRLYGLETPSSVVYVLGLEFLTRTMPPICSRLTEMSTFFGH
jgi:hypothetical protein